MKDLNVDEKMVQIPLSEFVSGDSLPCDVFIRLGENKYLCIARKGDKTQLRNISAIKTKALSSVFVRRDEYRRFVAQTLQIVEMAASHRDFKDEHRAFFLRHAITAVFTEIESFGASSTSLLAAREVALSTITVVSSQPRLSDILKGLNSASPSVFNLSIATSIFSVLIAQKIGWTSKVNIEKLALGGLLAEVGLRELPPELINKPRSEMTYDEVQRYEEHPFRGMRLLESIEAMPADILSIVYEHHENSMGLGYPRRLRELRMNPLAKVVALATAFAEMVVPNPSNPFPKSMTDALRYIEVIMGQPFNKEAMSGLRALVEEEGRKSGKSAIG